MDGTPKEALFSRVETVKSYQLDVPQVTELPMNLKRPGVKLPDGILTIDAFVKELMSVWKADRERKRGA